jgi:hypothetical protein
MAACGVALLAFGVTGVVELVLLATPWRETCAGIAFAGERCDTPIFVCPPLGGAERIGAAAALVTPTKPTLRASAPAAVHAAILLFMVSIL